VGGAKSFIKLLFLRERLFLFEVFFIVQSKF